MTLITRLDTLGDAVFRRFPYINHGGCCVYAAVVAECLLEHGIKAKGIVAANRAKSWSGGRKMLGTARRKAQKNTTYEWNEHGVTFGHVGLEFRHKGEVWHYDTKGCHTKSKTLDGMPFYRGKLTLEEMKQLTTGDQGWNLLSESATFPKFARWCGNPCLHQRPVDLIRSVTHNTYIAQHRQTGSNEMSIFVSLQVAAIILALIFSFAILVVIGPSASPAWLLRLSMVIMAIGGGAAINLMWSKV